MLMLVLMQKNVRMERERVMIRLDSLEGHSRTNSLNFFCIPEVADESFAKTESFLRK